MKLLVIGESCKDVFIYGEALRLAPEAPAPVFVPHREVSNPGMAANVVENLKALGATVEFITNTNKITKTRYLDDKTNHLLLRVDVGDSLTNKVQTLTSDFLNKFDAIVISDYCKGFVSESDIFSICNYHKYVFIDTKKTIGNAFKMAKYIKINSREYESSESSIRTIDGLEEKIIVTLGKEGCKLGRKMYPVEEVQVKDQVGAGDTFLSGLVVKYMETKNIDLAISFANECATKVVSKRGVVTI